MISARAIVVCPDSAYSAVMADPAKASELLDFTGLGLTDFYVFPHYESREFKAASETMVRENQDQKKMVVLMDKQAL